MRAVAKPAIVIAPPPEPAAHTDASAVPTVGHCTELEVKRTADQSEESAFAE